jgi:hypothetical protein
MEDEASIAGSRFMLSTNSKGELVMLRKSVLSFALLLMVALSSIFPAGLHGTAANLPEAPDGVVLVTPRWVSLHQDMVSLTITGSWFTPGGRVYVVLLDQWGVTLGPHRWVTASEPIYGPNGSTDPTNGYVAGGLIRETFEYACGSELLLMALDGASNTWSATMPVPLQGCNG